MNIKDILAKIAKGEELTDEEKKFVSEYDTEKSVNDAAAAARRKAETDKAKAEKERDDAVKATAALQKTIDDAKKQNLSGQEQSSEQIKTLSEQVGVLTKRLESSDKEKAALFRAQTVDALRQTAGIAFVEGVDESAMSGLFRAQFDGIDDSQLSDEAVVKTAVDQFRGRFKGVIRDDSGHGAGSQTHIGGRVITPGGKNPWKDDTMNLTEQARIIKENPADAKRLAGEAGKDLKID